MISYIIDEKGNRTHAVVPITKWNELVEKFKKKDAGVQQIIEGVNGLSNKTIPSVLYSMSILTLIDSPSFLKALKELFWFLYTATPGEIGFLYLLRNPEFITFITKAEFDKKSTLKLSKEFYITDISNNILSVENAENLRNVILNSTTPAEMLKDIKPICHIGMTKNTKRIRKDAEMKRLFIFDALESFTLMLPDLIKDMDGYKNALAVALYPNNTKESAMAQLNKAHREAKERVFHGKWKEYFGIEE